MGWKTLKQKFDIDHIVHVREKGVFIGSYLVSEILLIDPQTGKVTEARQNAHKSGLYPALFSAAPEEILEALAAKDEFSNAITVYTYSGAEILEAMCEEVGYPNVTHDGKLMYDNEFTTDRNQAIAWARTSAERGVAYVSKFIAKAEADLVELREELRKYREIQDGLVALIDREAG